MNTRRYLAAPATLSGGSRSIEKIHTTAWEAT